MYPSLSTRFKRFYAFLNRNYLFCVNEVIINVLAEFL